MFSWGNARAWVKWINRTIYTNKMTTAALTIIKRSIRPIRHWIHLPQHMQIPDHSSDLKLKHSQFVIRQPLQIIELRHQNWAKGIQIMNPMIKSSSPIIHSRNSSQHEVRLIMIFRWGHSQQRWPPTIREVVDIVIANQQAHLCQKIKGIILQLRRSINYWICLRTGQLFNRRWNNKRHLPSKRSQVKKIMINCKNLTKELRALASDHQHIISPKARAASRQLLMNINWN